MGHCPLSVMFLQNTARWVVSSTRADHGRAPTETPAACPACGVAAPDRVSKALQAHHPVTSSHASGLRLRELPATRLLPFHRLTATPSFSWHRWVEQRGGLLTTAGTVTPGIFACVTRPGRLVKDSRLGPGVSADPGVAPDFPRVCAWAARSLYPRFRM